MQIPRLSALVVPVFVLISGLPLGCSSAENDSSSGSSPGTRWTEERSQEWGEQTGWLVGANFTPSTAVNQLEMWQASTFDSATIDRELGYAQDIGLNSVRVYLHHLLWAQDSIHFLSRVDRFLAMAERHRIRVVLVLLDGVWDPEPQPGPQHPPTPRVHNSGWVQSPGREILGDTSRHDELRPYIQGVMRRFRSDRRVVLWDLFNEPDNDYFYTARELPRKRALALSLLARVFSWAREVDPDQPLTVAAWREGWGDSTQVSPVDRFALEHSDVITFHAYTDSSDVRRRIESLRRYGRPILCTEYMARTVDSRIQTVLPLLYEERVGAIHWGLVAGKTQTIFPWDSWGKAYPAEPPLWHHDLLRPDGSAYDAEEVRIIRSLVARAASR